MNYNLVMHQLRALAKKARLEMQENAKKDGLVLNGVWEPTSIKAILEYESYVMKLAKSITYKD